MRFEGIDIGQLRALLKCYAKLNAFGGVSAIYRKKEGGKPRGLFFAQLMYALFGAFVGSMAFVMDTFTFSVTVHFMTFIIAGMVVTVESGHILFNAQEEDVLGHRPIHPRTLILAKSIDLFALTFALTMALNLGPTICSFWLKNTSHIFPFVHLATVALSSAFCASGIVFVYGMLVRVVGRERFDNIANFVQIAMVVVFMCAQQVIPQMMTRMNHVSLAGMELWLAPLPPVWFAAIDTALSTRGASPALYGIAAMGLLISIAICWGAVSRMSSGYHLIVAAESKAIKPRKEKVIRPVRELNPFLRWWMPDPVEQAAFRLARAYMVRDRDMRMRLYPGLAYFLIWPLIIAFGDKTGGMFVFMFWVQCSIAPQVLEALRMGTNIAAADIFVIAPMASAGHVFQGCRKAAIYNIVLPMLISSIVLLGVLKPLLLTKFWIGLPALLAIPTLSLLPGLGGSYIPLSRTVRKGSQSKYIMGIMLMTMIIAGLIAGISYLAQLEGYFIHLLVVFAIVIPLVHWALTGYLMRQPFRPGAEEG